jgi:hypothetical protein
MFNRLYKLILKISVLLFLSCISYFRADAQHDIRDSSLAFPMIGATFAYQLPGGDMSERFGNNLNIGGVFLWKLKSNWILGIEGDFIFSDDVKEKNILDKYKTPDGNIINQNGQYADVFLYERGLKFDAKIGKIFPVIGPNKNSGLMGMLGLGYIEHKIRIETPESNIPYLSDEYAKGYDRLCSGFALTEFLGYMNFGNNRLLNFYAGFEFTQGFTKNRRELNFDTGLKDGEQRTDLLFGIRLGWVFPLYKRVSNKIYFN